MLNRINWVNVLSSIARDKGENNLAEYIGKFSKEDSQEDGIALFSASHAKTPEEQQAFIERMEQPVTILSKESVELVPIDYSGLSDNFAKPKYNITKMPEATCDGCQ